jgi:UDP-glucose 4-epimerase
MSSRPRILVTGGCGYIGTHTIVLLLQSNYDVTVVDNLSNSSSLSLQKVAEIVGLSEAERKERIVFHKVDICDEAAFRVVFETSPKFLSCIHFAGLKVSSGDY